MKDNLIIIESPNKIKTIEKYLSDDYKVVATIGHIRDLSTRGMGFDEKTLEPKWIISSKKVKEGNKTKAQIIKEINTAATAAKVIYLASDPDREGEAIAWHVYEVLSKENQKKCSRITFNEISKDAIEAAIKAPRKIDMLWVQSQFARRILDRLVGYSLSRLVRNKLRAESAGRVQTVALKFISDREKLIKAFKVSYWWTLDVILQKQVKLILREINPEIPGLQYHKVNDEEKGSGIDFKDQISTDLVRKSLTDKYEIYAIDQPKQYSISPKDPYKTSTMQQDAINKLGWNLNKVTSVSQKLYEGVNIDGVQTALISYPRTDSVRISNQFGLRAKDYILKKYGPQYYFQKERKNASGNVQDAHEAIRVIDPEVSPDSLKNHLNKDDYALYKLIWLRTISSFMAPAKYENTIIRITNNENKFYTFNRSLIFDGYRKIYDHFLEKYRSVNPDLGELKVGKILTATSVETKKHESLPPPRYTQASLVKELDEAGVGRPSTYRTMANMALQRGYCVLENKAYVMTEIGQKVISQLEEYFPYITNVEFTKKMEDHLDDIANKEENWKEWIREFRPVFDKDIKTADKKIKVYEPEKVGRKCPECGYELIYRYNHINHSRFIGCSNYPQCKHIESLNVPKILDEKCPECGHNLVERFSKKHRRFIGCSNYPNCTYIKKQTKDDKIINEVNKND